MLQKPSSKNSLEAVYLVHSLYQSKTIRFIDVEFHQPQGYKPVPFCIAICAGKTDKIILRTTMDYESATLTDIEKRFSENSSSQAPHLLPLWARADYLRGQWYQNEHTHDMSLYKIGQFLRNTGFTPETHCITNWHSFAYYVTFHWALLGRSMLFDAMPTNNPTTYSH